MQDQEVGVLQAAVDGTRMGDGEPTSCSFCRTCSGPQQDRLESGGYTLTWSDTAPASGGPAANIHKRKWTMATHWILKMSCGKGILTSMRDEQPRCRWALSQN